jgi:hypothetical protein
LQDLFPFPVCRKRSDTFLSGLEENGVNHCPYAPSSLSAGRIMATVIEACQKILMRGLKIHD